MARHLIQNAVPVRIGRQSWLALMIGIVSGLMGVSWWMTTPWVGSAAATPGHVRATAVEPPVEGCREGMPPWPEGRLEGDPAKRLLLETLLGVKEQLDRVPGYTATFRKLERINGTLCPEQVMAMKVRHQPFAIYFKFLVPRDGKEVVYAEGYHENKMIAHTPGVIGWLVPRLAIEPDSPRALAESRHPITEAGLANLMNRLIGFRRMDLGDPEAVTILDRITGPDGHPWLRSLHLHPRKVPGRPFARVEVLYDPEDRLPRQISSYDWPEPDHQGDLPLAERYAYEDLDLNANLSDLDFDPANPAYAFHY